MPTKDSSDSQQSTSSGEKDAESMETPKTTVGKGAPTPSRKQQEAARKRPLVPDPKLAKDERRQAQREARIKVNEAMATGDERYLPARDKGPQKRLVRNIVDSRTSIGEFMMPLVFIMLIASFAIPNVEVQFYVLIGFWVIILAVVVESFFLSRKIKNRLVAEFGEAERGTGWYAAMRSIQFRRLRMPKPQVARGDKV